MNPDIHIIVRTKYLKNIEEVIEAGADEVIPKEFETSILMFTRIMDYYNKDMDEIADAVNDLRSMLETQNRLSKGEEVYSEYSGDEYVEEGQDEVDSEAQGGSELGIQGADYKKMIQQIELLGNMQIKRTVYGLDKRVLANNSGSGVSNDYCRDEASEYLVDSEDDINQFKYSDSFLGNVYHILKESDIPVRISNTKRDVASNDIKPGFVKFFTRKANEERNIEYKFFVPAYTIKEEKDANGNIVIKKECYDSVPTDSYDFAELDVGSLNEMEDNVYYWNLLDHFIADYYKEYLPKVSGEIVIGSEEYEKIKKIIEDIYLLYNEMGPSRVCESVSAKNQCVYSNGGTGEAMQNVKVSLLQCADDTRFDPIPNETIVDLETYITGVVYAENGGSKNYEALKAQAVAARTYKWVQ